MTLFGNGAKMHLMRNDYFRPIVGSSANIDEVGTTDNASGDWYLEGNVVSVTFL